MRKTADFQVFADMRLAGVGMIGVVHATRPIDAIQRMIGRVELGIIPQVVDTVIFIEAGAVVKVYELNFTVKVPYGMFEADLARPVIEVRDFETKTLEYEIYTYGEQVVVMPVGAGATSEATTARRVRRKKAKRRRIKSVEEAISVENEIAEEEVEERGAEVEVEEARNFFILHAEGFEGRNVRVFADGEFLFAAFVSRKGIIRVRKDKEFGKLLKNALKAGKRISVRG